ncbi:hypothetical protein HRI_002260500 [Hibiscus trionum]|uniref:Uncharacterized protein n=1 Tax=Hibiscus trionum TaxID=183268 RepID=A0A9W7HYU2_HIBTR|nr:hypothetical protein HRI_002260500 [Hibiscus trionum]
MGNKRQSNCTTSADIFDGRLLLPFTHDEKASSILSWKKDVFIVAEPGEMTFFQYRNYCRFGSLQTILNAEPHC